MRLRNVDVRKYGSGNIGATNVLRVLGPIPALIVIIADVGKGALSALAGLRMAGPVGGAVAGAFAVVGHSFPAWLGFRGGKSVGTAGGALLVLAPRVAAVEIGLAAAIIAATKYVSLGSVTAAATAPIVASLMRVRPDCLGFIVFAGILIILRHKSNIRRLIAGNENKLGQKVPPR
jgi:glycerol-3-phosphate acyltransferase PlsY